MASQTTNIAITGHIDLRAEDLPRIKQKVEEKLLEIIGSNSPTDYSLLHGNAKGADVLVAEIAQSLGINIVDVSSYAIDGNYQKLAEYLVNNAHHLIALWDGIYNGKAGGTSEVVKLALKGGASLVLHHLVTPRQQNPYPVASLLKDVSNFTGEQFQRIPFTVHFSWIELPISQIRKGNRLVSSFKFIYQKLHTEVFMQFFLPMILVLSTLILGTLGFMQKDCSDDWQNALFKAVNLITFNNSVIDYCIPLKLNIARFLGLLTALSAFVVGLYLVLGKERRRLKVIFWSKFKSKKYVLVLGMSEKSYDLVKDLINRGQKVAILAPNEDSPYISEIEKLGAVFIKGNIYSASILRKLYHNQASTIYILSDSDTDNVRAMQELEQISTDPTGSMDRYVHIQDERSRNFLHENLTQNTKYRSNIFNVYENTSRRLLLYHPIDRFYQTPEANTACVIIIGFGNLGKQIALTCLRQGHFEEGKLLKIKVLCSDSITQEADFAKEYPFIKVQDQDPDNLKVIKEHIWHNSIIEFFELPKSDAELLSSKSEILKEISPQHIVSLYACLENGLESASYLTSLLPVLDYQSQKKNCNLQAFCFYNFPDKKEEIVVEAKFNELAPNIPVYCFGNFIDECSVSSIRNLALDALPKQIALGYAQIYGNAEQTAEQVWRNCSEQDKESNRQAADHLWVKVRTIWHAIDWKYDKTTFVPLIPDTEYKKYVEILSKIEHRRWCADILLKGFRPLQDEPNATELEGYWHKGGKKVLKPQKLHLDLKPFDKLSPHEQQKDENQIRKIPEFLRAIVNTD